MKITLLIAILLAGGGTATIAEQALPGDSLYPVKVSINERVKSWFVIGAEAEAELQADLLEERLAEIEQLASEGRFVGDVAVRATAKLAAQVDTVATTATRTEGELSVDMRARLTQLLSSLGTFREDLANLKTRNNNRSGGGVSADSSFDTLGTQLDVAVDVLGTISSDAEESDTSDMQEADEVDADTTSDEEDMEAENTDAEVDMDASVETDAGTTTVESETSAEVDVQ